MRFPAQRDLRQGSKVQRAAQALAQREVLTPESRFYRETLNPNLELETHPFVQTITPKLAKISEVCNSKASTPFS